MPQFLENLRIALESNNPRVREATLRTLEELVPRIEDREILRQIKELLNEIATKGGSMDEDDLRDMVHMVDSYRAVPA